ncbi:MAG: S41 family peptidase [Acidimicrobiia bacterium]
MRRRALGLVALLGIVAAACNTGAREAEPFEGNWESEGWGTFISIDGGTVEIYEHSSAHCMSVASGGARGISDVISLEGGRLVVRDAGRLLRFDPIEFLPESCLDDPDAFDPAGVFAVLAATVEENLAPPLDSGWSDRRAALAADLAGGGLRLREAMIALLEPLGDVQIRLMFGAGEVWPAGSTEPIPPVPGTTQAGNGGIDVGTVGEGIAYVGFRRLGSFGDDEEASERQAARVIDNAISVAPALILDLRSTDGGSIDHVLLIASRLVPRPRQVAALAVRASDGFVDAGSLSVTPLPTGVYDGEVAVLIGPGTVGVAETLAWMLSEVPGVTLIGSPTAGSPGPAMVRFLPNGWSLALPNLRVMAVDGTDLSGGVEPDDAAEDAFTAALLLLGD